MIAEFKIRNFYSLRDEQTLSFIPTNDDTSRDIYTEEVADGVSLLKIGFIAYSAQRVPGVAEYTVPG